MLWNQIITFETNEILTVFLPTHFMCKLNFERVETYTSQVSNCYKNNPAYVKSKKQSMSKASVENFVNIVRSFPYE